VTAEFTLNTARYAGSASEGRWASVQWGRYYGRILFAGLFVLPVLLAAFYFGLVASDRYVSETRFIVRSVERPAAQGAAAYLQSVGITRANDEAFAMQDFVRSRDLMMLVGRKFDLRAIWGREGADWVSRFGGLTGRTSDEALFEHFQKRIKVEKNLETGITTLTVDTYDPATSRDIARTILAAGEERINQLNARASRDLLGAVEKTEAEAAAQLAAATKELTAYRQQVGEVDPEAEAEAGVDRSSALEKELASLEAALQSMKAQAPLNPARRSLEQQVAAIRAQVAAQRGSLTSGSDNLAAKIDELHQLQVQADIAARTFREARQQLADARERADRQRVYLEQIAAPSMPDEPLEPRRMRYFLTVALASLWAFLIFYLLVSGSREHLNMH
jgi:capsular polysaccharide transport system permease protein